MEADMTTVTWPRFMSHEGGPAYVECVHADDHRVLQRKADRLLEALEMIAAHGSEPEAGVARKAVEGYREAGDE
jgi:hypothetical protein